MLDHVHHMTRNTITINKALVKVIVGVVSNRVPNRSVPPIGVREALAAPDELIFHVRILIDVPGFQVILGDGVEYARHGLRSGPAELSGGSIGFSAMTKSSTSRLRNMTGAPDGTLPPFVGIRSVKVISSPTASNFDWPRRQSPTASRLLVFLRDIQNRHRRAVRSADDVVIRHGHYRGRVVMVFVAIWRSRVYESVSGRLVACRNPLGDDGVDVCGSPRAGRADNPYVGQRAWCCRVASWRDKTNSDGSL